MFETILIQLGAFSTNVSISVAQLFLALLIIFSAVKVYKTKDYSQISTWHARFFMLMLVAESISAVLGMHAQKSFSEISSDWTFLYLFSCLILFNGANLDRVLYALFFGSILNAFSGVYDVFVTGLPRAIGYYTHALTYGNAAAVIFICAFGLLLFMQSMPSKLRMMTMAAAILGGYALFISGSRGPMLSSVITLFAMFIYIYRVKAAVILSLLVIILIVFIANDRPLKEKILSDRGATGTESSMGTRVVLWQTAIKGISERPLFGFGKGAFTQYVTDNVHVPLSSKAHAHNSYLQYAFSNGLFGSFFLIGFIVSLFNYIRRRAREYPPAKAAIFVFIVFLLEGLTENNFGDSEVVMLTMLTLAILTAPVRSYKNL